MSQEQINREDRAEKEFRRVRNNKIAVVFLLVGLLVVGVFLSGFGGRGHGGQQSPDGQASTGTALEGDGDKVSGTPGEGDMESTTAGGTAAGGSTAEESGDGETEAKTAESGTPDVGTEEPATDTPGTSEPDTTRTVLRNFIVCLDAGHGGNHGAMSPLDGRFESDDTLRLTLAVQRELNKYGDVTVVMTRTEDVDVDNGERAEIANEAGADLFISIHRNSNTTGTIGGIEGWIHSSNPADSRAAGEMILAAMEQVGVTENWGVKTGTWDEPQANYKVIRLAEMPAVLLEVGYVNYAQDNELFDRNLDKYATATARAIHEWLEEWVLR